MGTAPLLKIPRLTGNTKVSQIRYAPSLSPFTDCQSGFMTSVINQILRLGTRRPQHYNSGKTLGGGSALHDLWSVNFATIVSHMAFPLTWWQETSSARRKCSISCNIYSQIWEMHVFQRKTDRSYLRVYTQFQTALLDSEYCLGFDLELGWINATYNCIIQFTSSYALSQLEFTFPFFKFTQ